MGAFVCDQDQEDFIQERLIQDWASRSGVVGLEFKHITCKGTARNTLVRASISLDQKITDDSTGTFADFIAGSDGRDLECGRVVDDTDDQLDTAQALLSAIIDLAKTSSARRWAMSIYLESVYAAS